MMSFCNEHGTSDYCADCMAEIMQRTIDYQQARIEELEAERGWIPVGERLPEIDSRFLVYNKGEENCSWSHPIWLGRMTKSWGIARQGENGINPTITHWMPLPEPPEGEQ